MQISGFIALLGSMVVSRFITERSFRELDPEQKLRLMDGFSSTRMYSMIPFFLLIAGFWLLMTQTDVDRQTVTAMYFVLLIIIVVLKTVFNQRKLRSLEMPAEYQRKYMVAQAVSLTGVAWFIFTLM
ncbi:hypothetical protein [Rhodopirellula bahusiensis]|uniref:hypothetical protein n=1 Tax=Rhodopirellula bahusiensis TaxID=2014065 RepID=UPI0032675E69